MLCMKEAVQAGIPPALVELRFNSLELVNQPGRRFLNRSPRPIASRGEQTLSIHSFNQYLTFSSSLLAQFRERYG